MMLLPMLVMLGVGRMKGTRKLTFLVGSSAVITIVVVEVATVDVRHITDVVTKYIRIIKMKKKTYLMR